MSILETKNLVGVYVVKDISSNRIIRVGSSKNCMYEQISLFVQHYKIISGQTSIAFLEVKNEFIEEVIIKIKTVFNIEVIDDTFYRVIPFVLNGQPIEIGMLNFLPLYDENPTGPRERKRIKSNIAHLQKRPGVYVIQMSEKGNDKWHIEYVGKASNLNSRIHAHFIKSQAEYRPTSNYYHLRNTHDFKIAVVDFPKTEVGLMPNLENFLISQWDPPGNRYGRGLTKNEIEKMSSMPTWTPVENVDFF